MGITKSFLDYANVPSAVIWDGGAGLVPIWGVSQIALSETFHLPAIGSTSHKAIVSTHDDTVTLSGVLVGAERYAWKLLLETMAEASKRGTVFSSASGGKITGLALVTSMTIRTDMQIQTLSFTATSQKRDVLDVNLSLAHLPKPSALGKLLDVASVGVGALTDFGGN
jgi:hypothetical protein